MKDWRKWLDNKIRVAIKEPDSWEGVDYGELGRMLDRIAAPAPQFEIVSCPTFKWPFRQTTTDISYDEADEVIP